mmetsp:Transcript_19669/g.29870  ORF Transcript_19669/g.29870 Transcript_19669/m.29870 type:complete len:215 (-) Transcript_19669:712-1356(-)
MAFPSCSRILSLNRFENQILYSLVVISKDSDLATKEDSPLSTNKPSPVSTNSASGATCRFPPSAGVAFTSFLISSLDDRTVPRLTAIIQTGHFFISLLRRDFIRHSHNLPQWIAGWCLGPVDLPCNYTIQSNDNCFYQSVKERHKKCFSSLMFVGKHVHSSSHSNTDVLVAAFHGDGHNFWLRQTCTAGQNVGQHQSNNTRESNSNVICDRRRS